MAFTKHDFKDGDVLRAAHLIQIEDTLEQLVEEEIRANASAQSNWDDNDVDSTAYIHNKPIYITDGQMSWDGSTGTFQNRLGYLCLNEEICKVSQLLNSTINFTYKGITYNNQTISIYAKTQGAYDNIITNTNDDLIIALVDYGAITGQYVAGHNVHLEAFFINTGEIVTLGYYYSKVYFNAGHSGITEGGLYIIPKAWINSDGVIPYNPVQFTIVAADGTTFNCTAEENTTWEEWHSSARHNPKIQLSMSSTYVNLNGIALLDANGEVLNSGKIITAQTYTATQENTTVTNDLTTAVTFKINDISYNAIASDNWMNLANNNSSISIANGMVYINDEILYYSDGTKVYSTDLIINGEEYTTEEAEVYGTVLFLDYTVITTDPRYDSLFFGNSGDTSLHLVASKSLNTVDFSQFNEGDIVIVYTGSLV
jgi:hypothetical protein